MTTTPPIKRVKLWQIYNKRPCSGRWYQTTSNEMLGIAHHHQTEQPVAATDPSGPRLGGASEGVIHQKPSLVPPEKSLMDRGNRSVDFWNASADLPGPPGAPDHCTQICYVFIAEKGET